jgi:hypothetical protein
VSSRRIRRYARDAIADEAARRLLEALLALTVAGVYLLFRNSKSIPVSTAILAVLLLAVALAGLIITVVHRRSYKYATYPKVHFHFEVISKKIIYRINENEELEYSRVIKVRALQDNLDSYTDKFVWTGGECETLLAGDGATRVEPRFSVGIWTFYRVMFDLVLRQGEEHEFEVKWPALTNWKESSPFISASTDEPTQALEFDVLIPSSYLASTSAVVEELRGIESLYPFQSKVIKFEHHHLAWSPTPKLYRHYRLRWSWAGEQHVVQLPTVSS